MKNRMMTRVLALALTLALCLVLGRASVAAAEDHPGIDFLPSCKIWISRHILPEIPENGFRSCADAAAPVLL